MAFLNDVGQKIGDWFNGLGSSISDAWNQMPTLNDAISNAAASLSEQIGGHLTSFSSALEQTLKNSQLGTAAANKQAEKAAASARAWNEEQYDKNRAWLEHMSNTAYRRGRADMEAAGFNPILMYSQGGASTPSASPATADAAQTFKSSGVVDTLEVLSPVLQTLVAGMNSAFKTGVDSSGSSGHESSFGRSHGGSSGSYGEKSTIKWDLSPDDWAEILRHTPVSWLKAPKRVQNVPHKDVRQ